MAYLRSGAFAVLVICLLVAAASASPRTSAAADALESRILSSYDVTAEGTVRVSVAAQITNRDPTTERRASGRVLFYSAAALAVHEGATNIVARSAGVRLVTENSGAPAESGDPFRVVAVKFGRELYFNESIEIMLEYELAALRGAQVLVNRQYAFVPAIGQGTRSLIRITAPAGRQLTIGSANCARVADNPITFVCGASTVAAEYRVGGPCFFTVVAPRWDCAFTGGDFVVIPFEATAADLSLASRSSRASLAGGEVRVTVSYFAGDDAWATRIEEIVRRGLPLLEQANGYPYPGPSAIEIVESGYRDTHGYEGLAGSGGRIRLTAVVDDQTVLHEVSHLWSGVFASRWLAEGMADYTANAVARRLGLRPETTRDPVPAAPVLEEWGSLRSQIAVSPGERDLEESGYSRSLRFIEILGERAGAQTLARINARLAEEGRRATARTYLDLLEEVTGSSFEALFAEWALTAADAALLPERAAARAAADALRRRALDAGLTLPADIAAALADWEFGRAARRTDEAVAALDLHERARADAEAAGLALGGSFGDRFSRDSADARAVAAREAEAVAAVREARARLAGPRSPIERVGLAGEGAATRADRAAAALADGNLDAAIAEASAAQQRLDRAARQGVIRLSLAGLALLVFAGVALRYRRQRHRPAANAA